jgi:hypothetical protein
MNLSRTLNYAYHVPMGGSASFYSMVNLNSDDEIVSLLKPYCSDAVNALFIKILIHEVYEVRNPDYNNMTQKNISSLTGDEIAIPKNPAYVSITGSITPWNITDMKTTSICRILKNPSASQLNLDISNINNPIQQGTNKALGVLSTVNLAPVPFWINQSAGLLSLDLSNMLNEYGDGTGNIPSFAGSGDIPPYQQFINYNYGIFTLMFQPDAGGSPTLIGSITYDDYNMQQFISTAGMVDIAVIPGNSYSNGYFYLTLSENTCMTEDNLYITTDQQGIYAEQNQSPANLYMSDGLPRIPCTLRVFYRGVPVNFNNAVTVTMQAISVLTMTATSSQVSVFDGMGYAFPVNSDGCTTYAFLTNPDEAFPTNPADPNFIWQFGYFAANNSLIVCRVLSADSDLDPYLKDGQPITWEVVYTKILQLYKTIYPVMDIILPINEQTWSDPFIQGKILQLTDEANWNKPFFMPLTRDMSQVQRQLLTMWINQSKQS